MNRFFMITSLLFLLVSCKQKDNDDIRPVNASDTIVTEKEEAQTITSNEQQPDTIAMVVEDENGGYTGFGLIDSIHPRIYVKFTNEISGNLKASITPLEGDGNIRFNQIIFPDKTMDGPFGKELQYQLKTTGSHILVVGHSLMADEQYFGKFKINLQVTD